MTGDAARPPSFVADHGHDELEQRTRPSRAVIPPQTIGGQPLARMLHLIFAEIRLLERICPDDADAVLQLADDLIRATAARIDADRAKRAWGPR